MNVWFFAVGYLAIAVALMRLQVWTHAKEFQSLGWRLKDTLACLFFGFAWPGSIWAIVPLALVLRYGPMKTRTILPFKRWFEKDCRR